MRAQKSFGSFPYEFLYFFSSFIIFFFYFPSEFVIFLIVEQPFLIETPKVTKLETLNREQLLELAEQQQKANEYFRAVISLVTEKLTKLAEQEKIMLRDELLVIKRKFYSSSSEKRFFEKKPEPKERKEKEGPKVCLPSDRFPDIPFIEEDIDFEKTPTCKLCESTMVDMGVTEDAEYVTVTQKVFHIIKSQRHKYRCKSCHGDIKTAPQKPRLKPGSSFSDEIAIDVTVSKYADHMPVERYARQAERLGLKGIHPKTLIDQTHYLADALIPVYGGLKEEVQNSKILQADETPWKLLEGDERNNWWLWGFFTPQAAYYEAHDTRASKVAQDFLKDSKATHLLTDAYCAYSNSTKETKIKNSYCMAHARRKFIEAEPNYPEATPVIEWMGGLFKIEREIRGRPPDEILNERKTRSSPILKEIKKYLLEINPLPKSSLGKARDYMLKYWDGLTEFLNEPELSIDNNLSERGLRGPVIGRKNFYGNHSKQGAQTTQILYSVIESCKLNQVEPQKYLKETVENILNGRPVLTPSQYAKKNSENKKAA